MFVTEPLPGFALGFMKYFGTKEIDAKNSYIESVKTFSRNMGIRFYQTWVAGNADLMKRVQEGEESVVGSMGFVFYTNIYLLPTSRCARASGTHGWDISRPRSRTTAAASMVG